MSSVRIPTLALLLQKPTTKSACHRSS
uniref:Uncharacterized protein n=1 Tax=Arundo donax TaxID=35708 RepID=A0A0A9FJR1_ARUDO